MRLLPTFIFLFKNCKALPILSSRKGVLLATSSRGKYRVAPIHASSSVPQEDTTTPDSNYWPSNVVEEQVELSSGVSAQILSCEPSSSKGGDKQLLPPLYFLHGSFHGAWCWAEKYFEYFTSLGYPVAALSWRGTGGTYAGEGVKKVPITNHVADLDAFLKHMEQQKQNQNRPAPIVICHSFGGLAVMKYLESNPEIVTMSSSDYDDDDDNNDTRNRGASLSGVITMCSVPPSGNGKLTLRYLKRSFVDSYKITVGFAMKKCNTDKDLCRELFFGGNNNNNENGISDAEIERYQRNFQRDSEATIDLMHLAKRLPSKKAIDGVAPYIVENSSSTSLPFLVIGASDDFIVDNEALEETAKYFGTADSGPIVVDSPHDVMLGQNWKNGADVIHNWIKESVL